MCRSERLERWGKTALLAALAFFASAAPGGDAPTHSGRMKTTRTSYFNRETGEKEWELEAEKAEHVGQREVSVEKPRIYLYSATYEAEISSEHGMFVRSAQTATVGLTGGVVMLLHDAEDTRVQTPNASWDAGQHVASSEDEVVITRKSMIVTGEAFRFGPSLGSEENLPSILVIDRKVHALIKGSIEADSLFAPSLAEKARDSDAPVDAAGENITITCDGPFRVDASSNVARFRDNVRVEKGSAWLTADRLTIFFESGENRVDTILAAGNVLMGNPESGGGGRGDRMLWHAATGSGQLSGGPAISWLDDALLKGPRILFSTKDRSVRTEGRTRVKFSSDGIQAAPEQQ